MEGMGLLKFSDLFTELPVPPHAAGVVGDPGFGCTSPARAISRSSGSKSGSVVSGSVE